MKTILCYGDSNTWGFNPHDGSRYDHKTRWPRALERLLNAGAPPEDPRFWVVEEGLNGRTSCREDPVEGDRNGLRQVTAVLESHKPLDMVAVMLGTNDLKPRYSPMPYDIAYGVQRVVRAIFDSRAGPQEKSPWVLMVCPPPTADSPGFKHLFGDSVGLSKKLAPLYRQLAKEIGAAFLDAGTVVTSSAQDGIHFEPEEHLKLARAVADIITAL
ncbi:MAG: SGNH/GDSL hydrolase family protein [Spirochaetaceae bacterium]|jgi:lysophospholipase L1-like esterase|nr:SGNH/GDSL hydrolase family protein [Spirochaetaceae bacterium]